MLKNGLIIILLIASFYLSTKALQRSDSPSENKVSYEECGLSEQARALAKLVIEDPDQLRKELSCSSLLTKIAQSKAEEMAATGKVTHYGEGGTPDQRLINGGYKLYLPKGAVGLNHVEAILGGYSSPSAVLDSFKNSFHHRVHLFGEHEFFLKQNDIGVGYAYNWNSPHVDYWVIYIASRKQTVVENLKSLDEEDLRLISKPMK
ncbi:CAP domain-containing protein [Kangiella sediminilitoris]|uniref:CAP domain-containing protein n=1 Tax=Kangiella sediminilitoris TaxID=1144748 RepID=UPI00083E4F73|nr:CAP domain-containing protein [Kangiella sediminilitoris]